MAEARSFRRGAPSPGRPIDITSERQRRLRRIRDRATQLGKPSKLQQEPDILGDRDLRSPEQIRREAQQLSQLAIREREVERDATRYRLDLRPRPSVHQEYWDGERYVHFEVVWDGR